MALIAAFILPFAVQAASDASASGPYQRMAEWTIESQKSYADPFNDVEVDVVFDRDGQSWRVPTFWRGGQKWTVRFAPPAPGEYRYRLESTDAGNPDLNGHAGRVNVTAYSGANPLLRHGLLRVSANKRYFEHADGTPFYWLGDTWWTGMSDRLQWDNFRRLAADRKAKGFTVVQLVAGLVPSNEETPPSDPGDCNEGGCVWEPGFKRLNPQYFDYMDRRIQKLLDEGLAPAIVGGWRQALGMMGPKKMQQHWRNLIARYGAYPVFWIAGGEVFDPPPAILEQAPEAREGLAPGWTDIVRYIRTTDPYRHPLSVHEWPPPLDYPLQDETLSDFDLFQSSHFAQGSLATNVAQMNLHYARTAITKPIVQGEIGYENIGGIHLDDFQRAAFWLSMLNGAAGHTYGADGVFEVNTADKPLHRLRWSFLSWEEGMNLPGSAEIGMNARLLRQYRWWLFQPHPEWIVPRGATLLEPRNQINGFDMGPLRFGAAGSMDEMAEIMEHNFPAGEWQDKHGSIRNGYAAGVPGEVRMVYLPPMGLLPRTPPTILGLEQGVRYHAYLWEPVHGIRFDLGAVERPAPGAVMFADDLDRPRPSSWTATGELTLLKRVNEQDAVASVAVRRDAPTGLVLRYRDEAHYIAAVYAPENKALYWLDRVNGKDGPMLGRVSVDASSDELRLSAEVRGDKAIASLTDGKQTFTTPIVDLTTTAAGQVGLLHRGGASLKDFHQFELRRSPVLVQDASLERKLYDAQGQHRGDLAGGGDLDLGFLKLRGWDSFGRDKHILLDAYRPERFPSSGDWLIVLETQKAAVAGRGEAQLR